jgi:hypothetical protein
MGRKIMADSSCGQQLGKRLFNALTEYVQKSCNKARLAADMRNVAFAPLILQRRMASSGQGMAHPVMTQEVGQRQSVKTEVYSEADNWWK